MTRLSLALIVGATFAAAPALAKPDKEALERALDTLERATRSGDFGTRAMAVRALGRGPNKRVKPLIAEALTDPQWQVRRAAIDALQALGDKRGWERAVIAAMKDVKVDVDLGVLPILDPLGPSKGVKVLIKGLKDKGLPRPARFAKALARRGGQWLVQGYRAGLKLKGPAGAAFQAELAELPLPDALPLYAKGLKRYLPAVQKRILERIGAMDDPTDLKFIRPLLKSKDAAVAFEAAAILAERGDASGKRLLTEVAKGADEAHRLEALKALGGVASKDLFDICRPISKDRKASFELLEACYRIFFKGGNDKLQRHLEHKLINTDINHRAVAVRFIGEVKGRAALEDLTPLLGAGPLIIRHEAAIAAGRLGMREAIPALRDALMTAREKDLRLAILEALRLIKDAAIIPVVRFYITDTDIDVRRAAIEALVAVPDESAVGDLEVAMRDRDKGLRATAVRALVALDPERNFSVYQRALDWIDPGYVAELAADHGDKALSHLRVALSHDRDDVRAAAFAAMQRLTPATRDQLAQQLLETSKRPAQRLAALDMLTEMRGKRSKPLLESLTKDSDERVRVAAISALGRLGAKQSRQLLIDTTADPAEAIRVAAAAALMNM